MGQHPNVILMAVIKPSDLTRKTARNICPDGELHEWSDCLEIDGDDYSILIMEDDYDEGMQISAKTGDIVVYQSVTYGYGESISFTELMFKKCSLEKWCMTAGKNYHCEYEIRIGANYW